MLETGPALKVTIYLNGDTGSPKGFLYEELLGLLLQKGIAGASVSRPFAGFGPHRRLHDADAGSVQAEHLPVILSFIDRPQLVREVLPSLLSLITDGLVEVQPTEVLKAVRRAETVVA